MKGCTAVSRKHFYSDKVIREWSQSKYETTREFYKMYGERLDLYNLDDIEIPGTRMIDMKEIV